MLNYFRMTKIHLAINKNYCIKPFHNMIKVLMKKNLLKNYILNKLLIKHKIDFLRKCQTRRC